MKHRWHDVIVAIAEGRQVECKIENAEEWHDYDPKLDYSPLDVERDDIQWRVKYVPVVEVKYFVFDDGTYRFDGMLVTPASYTQVGATSEWDLKVTYEDGKPTNAELLE